MKIFPLLLCALAVSVQTDAFGKVDNTNGACTWIDESTVSKLLGGPLEIMRDGTTTIAVKQPGDIENAEECIFYTESGDRQLQVRVVSRDPERSRSWKTFLLDFRENKDFTESKKYSIPVFTWRSRGPMEGMVKRTGFVVPSDNKLYVAALRSKDVDDPQIEKFHAASGAFIKKFTDKLAANTRDLQAKKISREAVGGPDADSILAVFLTSWSRHYQRGEVQGNEIVTYNKVIDRVIQRSRYAVENVDCKKNSAGAGAQFTCVFDVSSELIGGMKATALRDLGITGLNKTSKRYTANFKMEKSGWESDDLDKLIKRASEKRQAELSGWSKMQREQQEREKSVCDSMRAGMSDFEKANTSIPGCFD